MSKCYKFSLFSSVAMRPSQKNPLIFSGGPRSNLLYSLFHQVRMMPSVSNHEPIVYLVSNNGSKVNASRQHSAMSQMEPAIRMALPKSLVVLEGNSVRGWLRRYHRNRRNRIGCPNDTESVSGDNLLNDTSVGEPQRDNISSGYGIESSRVAVPQIIGVGAWNNYRHHRFHVMMQEQMKELLTNRDVSHHHHRYTIPNQFGSRLWNPSWEDATQKDCWNHQTVLDDACADSHSSNNSSIGSTTPLVYILPSGSAATTLYLYHELQKHHIYHGLARDFEIWTVPVMFRKAGKMMETREVRNLCQRFGIDSALDLCINSTLSSPHAADASPKQWSLRGTPIRILDTPGWYRGFASLDDRLLQMWLASRRHHSINMDLIYAPITLYTVLRYLHGRENLPTKLTHKTHSSLENSVDALSPFHLPDNFRYIHTGGTETTRLQLKRYEEMLSISFIGEREHEQELQFYPRTERDLADGC